MLKGKKRGFTYFRKGFQQLLYLFTMTIWTSLPILKNPPNKRNVFQTNISNPNKHSSQSPQKCASPRGITPHALESLAQSKDTPVWIPQILETRPPQPSTCLTAGKLWGHSQADRRLCSRGQTNVGKCYYVYDDCVCINSRTCLQWWIAVDR